MLGVVVQERKGKERPIRVKYGRNLAQPCCWKKKKILIESRRVKEWWKKRKSHVRKLAKKPRGLLILTGARILDPFFSKSRFETLEKEVPYDD